jgi:hypothetical protein
MSRTALLLAAAGCAALTALALGEEERPAPQRRVLVEVFTSQG